MLKLGIDSEVEVEVEVQLEPATAVSLVAPVPVHLLGEFEREIAELRADCLEGLYGEWWFQDPPSEAHDLAWALLEDPERCCH